MTSSKQLSKLESIIAIAYAVSLPLSMTLSWILLVIGLLLVALRLSKADKATIFAFFNPPLAKPLYCFAAAIAISGLFCGFCNWSEAWESLKGAKWILIYLWAANLFLHDRNLAKNCLKSFLSIAAVAGIFGCIQQIFNFHPFGYKYLQGTGFLASPMVFAGQMQVFSMLALGIAAVWQKQNDFIKTRTWLAFVVVGNVLGVIFAGERSAWLGAMVGIIVMAAMLSRKMLLKCILALAVIAAVGIFTVPLIQVRLGALFNPQADVSVKVRTFLWGQAIECFKKSPITGLGFRQFPHFDIPEAIVPGHSKDINHAHNNYLHILATTGLLGFVCFIWMWLAAIKQALFLFKQSIQKNDLLAKGIALGILGGIVSLSVAGLFEYNFGAAQVLLVQWFVIGLLCCEPN